MLIKKHKNILTPPNAHLINLSLKHSTFPTDWKHGIFTPIFKYGDCLKAIDDTTIDK